jgi:hypothetical protein
MACVDTILIDGVDLGQWAAIENPDGLLSSPPVTGDLIEMDWTPGAEWQPGVVRSYTFDVGLVMRSTERGAAIAALRAVQAACKPGTQVTVTRRLTVGAGSVEETCQAVVTSATEVRWGTVKRLLVIFTCLSGGWT